MADLLAERTITWGDTSTETVKIDSEGYFWLGGVKKFLIGMDDSFPLPDFNAPGWQYWLESHMAVFELEFACMQLIGFRLMEIDPRSDAGWGECPGLNFAAMKVRYRLLFQLAYDHKILVIARHNLSAEPNFKTGVPTDFDLQWTDVPQVSVLDWTTAYAEVLAEAAFPNVVAINIGNELNNLGVGPPTAANLGTYVGLMKSTMQAIINVPVVSNLVGLTGYLPATMTAIQNALSWQACDIYAGTNLADYITRLEWWQAWLASEGKPTRGWWLLETNWANDSSLFTWAYLNEAFKHGAAIAIIHRLNGQSLSDAGLCSFDVTGNPLTGIINIGKYVQSLQKIGNLISK